MASWVNLFFYNEIISQYPDVCSTTEPDVAKYVLPPWEGSVYHGYFIWGWVQLNMFFNYSSTSTSTDCLTFYKNMHFKRINNKHCLKIWVENVIIFPNFLADIFIIHWYILYLFNFFHSISSVCREISQCVINITTFWSGPRLTHIL